MSKAPDYLRHISFCTQWDPAKFAPFRIGTEQVGYVLQPFAPILDETFQNDSGAPEHYAARTEKLRILTERLCTLYQAKPRHEMYPIVTEWGAPALAEIDRIAVPWFGVRGFGVHVNGFVRKADGIHMWIAKRAADRLIDPGKLDNIIGGGLPVGLTIAENLVKEAWEEAGISKDLALTAKPASRLNYKLEKMLGLRNDTLFVYDLELPEDIIPQNTDGEVESFTLMQLADVAELIRTTDNFKFNCNLVIIDFMLRHGFFDAEPIVKETISTALATLTSSFPKDAIKAY